MCSRNYANGCKFVLCIIITCILHWAKKFDQPAVQAEFVIKQIINHSEIMVKAGIQ